MLSPLKITRVNTVQREIAGEAIPRRVSRKAPHEWEIRFSDGSSCEPSCLRCPDAPCLRFGAEEVTVPGFAEFPCDGDLSVCPTGALEWPLDAATGPSVTASKCIGCGLCVVRCPVNAIVVEPDGVARVLDEDSSLLRLSDSADAIAVRKQFSGNVTHRDPVRQESDAAIEQFVARMRDLAASSGSRFPNLATRNLMIAVGWQAASRRSGDTNMRIDVLAETKSCLCVTEVELSDAIIDTPRSVLDGVAVLHGRYARPMESLVGLVCAAELPNQRSEYWQVIADIKNALGLGIHTLTVPSLVLCVWARVPLRELPYAASGRATIRDTIESQLGRAAAISSGVAAALEVAK